MSRPLRFILTLCLALCGILPAAQGQAVESRATRDAATPLSSASDMDASEGEDAWESAQQALAKAGSEPESLHALVTVVNLQRRRGDFIAGLNGAREGLNRARKLGDLRLQVDFLYLLGRLYWNLTDYPHSLESHLEELKFAQQLGDDSLLARTHGGLGLTYQRFGRNEEALQHFRFGLEFAAKAGDIRIRSSLLNSLGNYHLNAGNYDQAETLHEEALKLRESYNNRRAIAESLTNLGLIADARGDSAKALDYLGRALSSFEALKYRRYIVNSHRRLALVLRRSGRLDEALAHLRTGMSLAETLESTEVLADLYKEFALTSEARGEFAAALDYERKHAAATEQMRGEQDRQRMSELRARYGAEQRELEITLLKRDQELKNIEIQRRRSQLLTLAAGLVGGLLFLGVVIMLQRYRLRAERRLLAVTEDARERAEVAERLKSRLLQIASHDLKVPLTTLNAAAGLITRTPGDAEAVCRLADSIQSDTARMRSLVRDFLDASAMEDGNLQLHTAEQDLGQIAHDAVSSLDSVAATKSQRLVFASASAPLSKVRADSERLRQVFDNLIGNALKFTPPGGDVTVAVGEAEGWVFAEVRDSGPGLGPEDFARMFSP